MKHYGDICQINGHEVPLVDVITGGSNPFGQAKLTNFALP